jgi:hypothetical protein
VPLCAPFLYCDYMKTSVHTIKLRIFKTFCPLHSSTMELESHFQNYNTVVELQIFSTSLETFCLKCTKLQLKLSSCSSSTL